MRALFSLVACVAILGAAVTSSIADERADWGRVVSTNWEDSTLLLQNENGFQLVVVDAAAEIRSAGNAPITLSDIQAGDRVDYEVAGWAGMDISEFIYVTSSFRAQQVDRLALSE
jgi:hypothetical protein